MNFLAYALFLFPFVASAVQSTQDEGGPSPLNPAELQFALVGLTAMSRSLWLETHYGTKQTAEEITKDIIGDIIIETNSLLILNHSTAEPVEDEQTVHKLVGGLGSWELQTGAFLHELKVKADNYKGHGHEKHLAGNLTLFKDCSVKFCHDFEKIVPDLSDLVGKVESKLSRAFEETLKKFKKDGGIIWNSDSPLQAGLKPKL